MEWLFSVVVAAVIALSILARIIQHEQKDGFPYEKQETLFSAAEQAFLDVLKQATDGTYRSSEKYASRM